MKAIIMAGGKGTRISSITTAIPKTMLPINHIPIIEHQIKCLKEAQIIDEVIVVIGHLGNVIKNYLKDGSNFGIKISYIEENSPLGTAGALFYLKEKIKDDFIFLFGDVFFNIDFNRMISYHKEKNSDGTLFVHPNTHPFDSVLIDCDRNGKITGIDSKRIARNYDYNNNINAGIFIFSPKIFQYIQNPVKMDLENDIIVPMIANNLNMIAYKSTEYAKDMGTPERYDQVNQDYNSGLVAAKNLMNAQKCIFLDRDGTLNSYVGFLKTKEQLKLLPYVIEAIKKINESEYLCIVATNQPVVARGEVSAEKLEEIHRKLETLLGNAGVYVDDIYYCPHHPDKGFKGEIPELKFNCNCRKPNIGLIIQACHKYNIDLNNSWIIGDTTTDIMLGKNAQMQSVLLKTGLAGTDKKYDITPDIIAENLNEAVNQILARRRVK